MFADPISVNVDDTVQNHTRTALGQGVGEFTWIDPSTGQPGRVATIKQSVSSKRFRREFRLAHSEIVEDPLNATNAEAGFSVYLVIDEPRYGFTDATLLNTVKDLCEFLTRSSGANTSRLLLGEY